MGRDDRIFNGLVIGLIAVVFYVLDRIGLFGKRKKKGGDD